jgi:hypothetical protein|uniref:Peptidase n=1 Tax=Myoviridae sp. ctXXl13 TaxID=2827691 RepID=A0A8S5TJF6_9CAUD|nr:MAG TPA: peptidase [Myoviridae sp. ctXXl13]
MKHEIDYGTSVKTKFSLDISENKIVTESGRNRIDKESLESLENSLSKLCENTSYSSEISNIENILKREIGNNYHIRLLDYEKTTMLRYMNISPDKNGIDMIIDAIVASNKRKDIYKIWKNIDNWYVNIDIRILTTKMFTPRQLTAMLLHEIGHSLETNTFVIDRVIDNVQWQLAQKNIGIKAVFNETMMKYMLRIPIIRAIKASKLSKQDYINEIGADYFAVSHGYAKELKEVFDIIVNQKTSIYQAMKNRMKEYDKVDDLHYYDGIIDSLRKRKSNIARQQLKLMIIDKPVDYLNDIYNDTYDKLFKTNPMKSESVNFDNLMESVINAYDNAYYTEAFSIFKKKLKKIDKFTPDYIRIRMGDMKTNDDKLLLISYIHSKIDIIDFYLDILKDPELSKKYIVPNSTNELNNMRKDLERSRELILKQKIEPIRYGLDIVYPKGYEG